MRLQHIYSVVFNQPWLIKPEVHAAICEIVLSRMEDGEMPTREGEDICGRAVELEQMEVIDGIAHIPIAGVLARRVSNLGRGSGVVDVGDIGRELAFAETSPEVRGVILDIDSPGGAVSGIPELVERIKGMSKTVFAYSAGAIGSAAYWLASAADQIYATQSSDIGSIGAYYSAIDTSKKAEMMGYKVDVIKSGKYKGAGFPGTSLTEEQRAEIQRRVDMIGERFRDDVISSRPGVSLDALQGQSFLGAEALSVGLIDGLVMDKQECARLI